MTELQGRRVDVSERPWPPNVLDFEPGDYALVRNEDAGRDEVWFKDPIGNLGRVSKHTITVHDDGAISVEPSIADEGVEGAWHGYLRKGVWSW